MKALLFTLCMAFNSLLFCQNPDLKKKIIIKTNILSLVAGKPTFSLEKIFADSWAGELSFVQGRFDNVFITDHYSYEGFLIRGKKYFENVTPDNFLIYSGLYAGFLKRSINTAGHVDNTGWMSIPQRDFKANSIRGEASLGTMYITSKGFVIDGQVSLGYGNYTKVYKGETNTNGYLDAQIWLSLGYCF